MRTDGIEPPIVKPMSLQPISQTKWESFPWENIKVNNYFPAAGSPTTTLFRLNRH